MANLVASGGSTLEFSNKSGCTVWQCVQVRKTRLCFCFSFPPGLPQFNLSDNRLTSGRPVIGIAALPCLNSGAEGKGKRFGDAEHCVAVSAWFKPVRKWWNATRHPFSLASLERGNKLEEEKIKKSNSLSCSWVHSFKKKESKHGIWSKPIKKLKSKWHGLC